MASTNVWRGQTQRDRSAERRAKLLDVGERLLGSGGSAALTMRAVCRDAQLSPRYFYESFDSREELLIAVYNRVEEELVSYVFSQRFSKDVATVDYVLECCADFFGSRPDRARILLREPLADDTLRKHSASRTPAFIKALIPVLDNQARELLSRSSQEVALISTALGGSLIALYLDWADGRLNITREELVAWASKIAVTLTVLGRTDAVESE